MMNVPAILEIENDFNETIKHSQKITIESIKKFNIFTRLVGYIMRLVAPLI